MKLVPLLIGSAKLRLSMQHDAWLAAIRDIAKLVRSGDVAFADLRWVIIEADSYDFGVMPETVIEALHLLRVDVAFFKEFRENNRKAIVEMLINAMVREEEHVLREIKIALENQLVLFPLTEEEKKELIMPFQRALYVCFNVHNNDLKLALFPSLLDHIRPTTATVTV